jgi:hypothetical protein
MKDRPIIFSGEMVRAILSGRKSVTRRVVKLPDPAKHGTPHAICPARESGWIAWYGEPKDMRDFTSAMYETGFPCPYGVPGDRLWVREAWRCFGGAEYEYLHDPAHARYRENAGLTAAVSRRWKSPILMPRWASRLTLEITDVRVERLQDLTHGDVWAELGREPGEHMPAKPHDWDRMSEAQRAAKVRAEARTTYAAQCADADNLFADFARGWDSINGKRAPWDSNPWVWALTFRRVEA